MSSNPVYFVNSSSKIPFSASFTYKEKVILSITYFVITLMYVADYRSNSEYISPGTGFRFFNIAFSPFTIYIFVVTDLNKLLHYLKEN